MEGSGLPLKAPGASGQVGNPWGFGEWTQDLFKENHQLRMIYRGHFRHSLHTNFEILPPWKLFFLAVGHKAHYCTSFWRFVASFPT